MKYVDRGLTIAGYLFIYLFTLGTAWDMLSRLFGGPALTGDDLIKLISVGVFGLTLLALRIKEYTHA